MAFGSIDWGTAAMAPIFFQTDQGTKIFLGTIFTKSRPPKKDQASSMCRLAKLGIMKMIFKKPDLLLALLMLRKSVLEWLVWLGGFL